MRTHPTDRRPNPERGASRAVMIGVGVAALAAVAALAVPKLLPQDDPVPAPETPVAPAPVVEAAAAAADVAAPAVVAVPAAAPGAPVAVPTSADGDLAIDVRLRTPIAASGARLAAIVRFSNTSLKAFHLPAPSEAHPSLALVLLDADGNEVRRVIESSADPYPRRTFELKPGRTMELPVDLVGSDDSPLAPGTYTVAAEFRRDPMWGRLGLPMWPAPRGSVRSEQIALTVVASEPAKSD